MTMYKQSWGPQIGQRNLQNCRYLSCVEGVCVHDADALSFMDHLVRMVFQPQSKRPDPVVSERKFMDTFFLAASSVELPYRSCLLT